ncbi:MAG: glutaredoxin-3 [Rhodothalassiaceae bacterium]|nr:MAG: glutaredoxin-3 [Rhodothalassiaceae bacterium]
MAEVVIYTKSYCPYCRRAKALLRDKGVAFTEMDVEHDAARFAEMVARAGGRRTVPQIFIGGRHVGGCDDLLAAEGRGDLDRWLKEAAAAG